MTKQQAITEYRAAIVRQNAMPADVQWMMADELKILKARALVEVEFSKLNFR